MLPAACEPAFVISEGDRLCVASWSPPPGDWKSDAREGGEIPRGIVTIDSRREPAAVSTSAGPLPTSGRGGCELGSPGEGGTAGASGIVGESPAGGSVGAGGATGGGVSVSGGVGSPEGGSVVGCSGVTGGSAGGCSGGGGSAGGCSGGGGSAGGCSGGGGGSAGGCSGVAGGSCAPPPPLAGSTGDATSPEAADPSSARASAASTRLKTVARAQRARRAAQPACINSPVPHRARQSAAVGKARIGAASQSRQFRPELSASHSHSDMSTQIYCARCRGLCRIGFVAECRAR
jgi:hypothetical protein